MKQPVSLIALDMDGTLFNGQSEISKEDQDAIREASSRGIHVAISTGRPYAGLPVTLLSGLGVSYAITSNGAAIYHLPDRLCIHECAMEPALVCPIIEELQKKSIHMDAFINGDGFSQRSCEGKIDCLDMPVSIKRYIHRTRTFTDDLAAYIRVHNLNVQKMTLNFYPQEDGTFLYRDEVMQILSEPKNAIVKQYQKLLELDGVDLIFDQKALEAIAETSLKRKTGARGLRAIMENIMMDIMYKAPSDETLKSCRITEDVVKGIGEPECEHASVRSESA